MRVNQIFNCVKYLNFIMYGLQHLCSSGNSRTSPVTVSVIIMAFCFKLIDKYCGFIIWSL